MLKNIQYCKNLSSLNLTYFPLNIKILESFESILTNLHTLQLSRCELSDNHLLFIIPLKNLKVLDLIANILLTGIYLHELKSRIEELYLDFCTHIDYESFRKYLYSNQNNLRKLSLSFDNNLCSLDLLNVIVETQPNLEVLNIGELKIKDYMPLMKLQKLTSLTCHQLSSFTLQQNLDDIVIGLSESFFNLVELDISFCVLSRSGQNALKQLPCLENLKIKRLQIGNGNFDFVTELKSLKTLEFLDVSYCKLTDEDCLDIIQKGIKLKVSLKFLISHV